MEEIIFITNQYLPKPGATGLCVHQLAKELSKSGNSVYTVCYEDGSTLNKFDGVKTIKIKTPLYIKDNVASKKIMRKFKYFCSLCGKFIHILHYPLRSNKLVNNYLSIIDDLMKSIDKATVVASYTPVEACIAGMKAKKKYGDRIKSIIYSTDTLSNEQGVDGILSSEYRMKCGMRWEKKLFSCYDKILIMECHSDHYMSDFYRKYQSKISVVNFPLLNNNFESSNKNNKINRKINMVYAGTLYQKLRNPEFLCSLLSLIGKTRPIEAFFLGSGDCEEIIMLAEKKSNNSIHYLGMKTHKEALKYINDADVLLSIGNSESPMAPSKIYEYMSTGKPIIHTYTYEKDPCIAPLKKYGNALLIPERGEITLDNVLSFLNNMKLMKYEEVEALFISSTPEYTTKIILEC